MPRVNGLNGIIEVSKLKEVTFGPYIPGYSDEEDSIDSDVKVEQVAKVEEQLITFEQDELEDKVAAISTEEEKPALLLKSAAQIFLEEKAAADKVKKKVAAKLALLEEEVKIGHQLLLQSKTLVKSQEALLLRKVRVKYNKCHSFSRGKVISAHRSFVDEQVAAAKVRLGLQNTSHQFNIPAMVALIDKLAPSLLLCLLRLQGLGGGDLLPRWRSHVCATSQLQFPQCQFGSVARGLHIQLQQCNQGTEVT